jgi:hypothetical protein
MQQEIDELILTPEERGALNRVRLPDSYWKRDESIAPVERPITATVSMPSQEIDKVEILRRAMARQQAEQELYQQSSPSERQTSVQRQPDAGFGQGLTLRQLLEQRRQGIASTATEQQWTPTIPEKQPVASSPTYVSTPERAIPMADNQQAAQTQAASQPKYNRLNIKDAKRVPPGYVYAGRRNVGYGVEQSPLANPYSIGDPHPTTGRPMTRDDVVQEHRKFLWNVMQNPDAPLQSTSRNYNPPAGREVVAAIDDLARKAKETGEMNLVCWCPPGLPCHCDTIAKAATWRMSQLDNLSDRILGQ